MTKLKNFKYKNGLWWLVFLLAVLVVLERHPEFISGSKTPQILKHVQSDELYKYPSGFLKQMDERGHAIEKHVGKSDDYLRWRLDNEDISAASTFNDMEEAETAIRTILINRHDLIRKWLDLERSNRKAFYWHMDKPVGRVLKREWNRPRAGNQARVVLIRDLTDTYKFAILTAYPEYK
jgi:hypothetical protein